MSKRKNPWSIWCGFLQKYNRNEWVTVEYAGSRSLCEWCAVSDCDSRKSMFYGQVTSCWNFVHINDNL